jgi:hypothetical protein
MHRLGLVLMWASRGLLTFAAIGATVMAVLSLLDGELAPGAYYGQLGILSLAFLLFTEKLLEWLGGEG